jgi:hypothetical protein
MAAQHSLHIWPEFPNDIHAGAHRHRDSGPLESMISVIRPRRVPGIGDEGAAKSAGKTSNGKRTAAAVRAGHKRGSQRMAHPAENALALRGELTGILP